MRYLPDGLRIKKEVVGMGQIWKRTPTPKKRPTEKAIEENAQANLDTSEVVSDLMVSTMDSELIMVDLLNRVAALEAEKGA